jgi:serine/threonine protein kinase
VVEQIDQVCDRFETAWMQGKPLRIEDFLGDIDSAVQSSLLRELVALELAWRRRHGERPQPDDYYGRFPQNAAQIDAAFHEEGSRRVRPYGASPANRTRPGGAGDDLLFGILALQNNFIDRTNLLAAFNAWVAEKARPLGRILVDMGLLDDTRHNLTCALVQAHLKQNDNDLEKSLAGVNSVYSVQKDLEGLGDPELSAILGQVNFSTSATASDQDATSCCVAVSRGVGKRFRILRPHAQGGLGQVFVAQDGELHREVALKEIQDQFADDPHSRSRFVQEAEITGGLEHPGVVPVYSLGQYDDGRPFYAMRFVKGNTFKEAIRQFHEAEGSPNRDRAERSLALRRLLDRFLDVCNAVAYAHSRGVLHRDLKPGNILLGPYGETLVVDWGLAKVVGRKDAGTTGAEPTLRPPSGSGVESTLPNSALGTPGYMSPEQAAGDLDRLGPRSDVYSLGATFYYLLTNRSPFPDSDITKVLAKTRRGDFPSVRSIKHDTPPALEAICMKAMALEPVDRYASPRELADDIERWVADERVEAYGEPLSARSLRWMRKHPVLVTSATVLLLFSIALLSVLRYAQLKFEDQQRARANFELASSAFEKMKDLAFEALESSGKREAESSKASRLRNEIRALVKDYTNQYRQMNDFVPLRIVDMTIMIFRPRSGKPNEPLVEDLLGTVNQTPDHPMVENDSVQIRATLAKPAYAYLIAMHPNGQLQCYYPESHATSPPLATNIDCPTQTEEFGYQVTRPLTDGAGLQAFVLVVADQPLPPYRDWIKNLKSPLPWNPSADDAEGVWRCDGPGAFSRQDAAGKPARLESGRLRMNAPVTFVDSCNVLAKLPAIKAIRAWAFPVRPNNSVQPAR